jgi:hypothetical protein
VVKLTKTFSADEYARGLESWAWLDLGGKTPLFASLFGDVFFDSEDGCWYLDTLEGELTRPWDSREATEASLATPEGQDQYVLGGLAMSAERSGITLGPSESTTSSHHRFLADRWRSRTSPRWTSWSR